MNYDKPELVSLLASQYVLGTLRGPARRRFERLRGNDAAVQEAVEFWEDLLQPLALGVDAVSPPPALRARLLARAFAAEPVAQPRPVLSSQPSTAARPRRRGALLRSLGFLAAASVSGVMLVLSAIHFGGGRLSFPAQRSPILSQAAEVLQPMPIYLAQMRMPASSMGWMISLSPDHQTLQIVASDDFPTIGRGAVQLWWLPPDGVPRSLALLGTERDSTVTVAVPPGFASGNPLVFAISLEPSGGSPNDTPSGPVLDRAEQADAI